MNEEYSLYIHIPFCVHRCAYCDFNTYANQETMIPAYVEALCREIAVISHLAPERMTARTVYFGGGTPSLLSTFQFDSILQIIAGCFNLAADVEISLEANPGTVTRESLRDLHSLGFNRMSLGAQSAHPQELRQLERIHDYFDVINAVAWARQAGFNNLNLDLIFGLPEQTLKHWESTITLISDLHPDHLSLYALTVEDKTPYGRWIRGGLQPLPDPDLAADMYELAGEALEEGGFEQYEISNWARPGRECRHNLQYWRGRPYLGFGAGAHGWAHGWRISNVLRIKTYIERLSAVTDMMKFAFPKSPATVHQTRISKNVEMQETMMTGLRLTREGVCAEGFYKRFGVEMMAVFGREINELVHLSLLEWAGTALRLTKRGRLLGNQVFMRFVD
jgi:oxygen-independent coproporphyrinogen III oxidase